MRNSAGLCHWRRSSCFRTGGNFRTAKVDEALIAQLIQKHFDLRPAGIIKMLDLRRPIYRQTAAYGHFGRTDVDLPWERTDKAAILRSEAKL